MPHFSQASKDNLDTCHEHLQRLFRRIIKTFDCTIVCGHRPPSEQKLLYEIGRTRPGSIVTYKDGVERLSKHNHHPSLAVDVVPYPIDWNDTDRMYYFAGHVMCMAYLMGLPIRWGGDWNRNTETEDERFVDLPHFEVMR